MRRLLIAQLSDLHLGARLDGGCLALPEEKVEQRRTEQRECLESFVAYVRERRPDMVLLPGDLFSDGEPPIDDMNFVIGAVNRMSPTQVFIAPGDHDAYTPSSCYNTESALYQSRGGGPKWGGHVRIFTGEQFEAVAMPHHKDVTVTGVACHRQLPEGRHVLADVPEPPEEGIHLLLFHGSLLGYPLAGADAAAQPFTPDELRQAGYAYAAVGHYHRGGPILGEHGRVVGAYAGAPFARTLADEGVGFWLEVEVDPAQPLTEQALHRHRCESRSVRRIELDVTGLTDAPALAQRLDEQLADHHADPRDILYVVLTGRLARGVTFQPEASLRERFFHVRVDDSGVEPDYEVDFAAELAEPPGLAATSEEVFRWRMLKLYHDATTDDARARIREALLYGLDALALGEVHLR